MPLEVAGSVAGSISEAQWRRLMEHVFLLPQTLCISTAYRSRSPIPNKLNR